MKMKRWMILTAVFAVLVGSIAASSCQTNNIASTANTEGNTASSNCDIQIISGLIVCDFTCRSAKACSQTCATFDCGEIEYTNACQYCNDCGLTFFEDCAGRCVFDCIEDVENLPSP